MEIERLSMMASRGSITPLDLLAADCLYILPLAHQEETADGTLAIPDRALTRKHTPK